MVRGNVAKFTISTAASSCQSEVVDRQTSWPSSRCAAHVFIEGNKRLSTAHTPTQRGVENRELVR